MAELSLERLSRSFGEVQALDAVDLTIRAGEVHALVGENGAGKSTLVKIVAGLLQPDSGTIRLDGQEVRLTHRRDAAAAGIGVVHQHFSLVDTLTVAENVQLGRPGTGRVLDLDAARRDLRGWSARTGLTVHADARVGTLSVGERQRVEILTALAWGARVLLLDEPTAVLSPEEADSALEVVHGLATEGLAVLLVTHKLREVEMLADRVTVLRNGVVVGRHDEPGVDRAVLAAEVMGEGRTMSSKERPPEFGPVRLEVAGVTSRSLHGVDLSVRGGEVLGVAGVAGNGQTDLLAVLAGLIAPKTGSVRIDGAPVHGNPRAARSAGLAFVPEDRAADGLALEMPVWVNAVAKRSGDIGGWRGLDRTAISAITTRVIDRLGVRPARPEISAGSLSGGNQQRLVLGRELDGRPGVIVAAEPTRGLDPGTANQVVSALRAAAREGAAVLIVASDLDELLDMADTIVVLFHGSIVGRWEGDGSDRAAIGHAMVSS